MQAAECVDTLQSVLEQLPDLNQPTVVRSMWYVVCSMGVCGT